MPSQVRLRPAEASDAHLLFEFLNREDSLAGKQETRGPIPWEDHQRWFANRLHDPHCLIFVILAEGDRPAGQVRLEEKGHGHEVDIYVDSGFRGQGIAAAAIEQAMARLSREEPSATVIAAVKESNAPSLALFRALGFQEVERHDGFVHFLAGSSR